MYAAFGGLSQNNEINNEIVWILLGNITTVSSLRQTSVEHCNFDFIAHALTILIN